MSDFKNKLSQQQEGILNEFVQQGVKNKQQLANSNYDGHADDCDCAVCEDIQFRKNLKIVETELFIDNLSKRGHDWLIFASKVLEHIELYTVPQYGDKGSDLASEYTIEETLKQAEKYIKRYGRNQREGQQGLDFLKAVHYLQMASTKYSEEKENYK